MRILVQVGSVNSQRKTSRIAAIEEEGGMVAHSVAAMVCCDKPIVATNHGGASFRINAAAENAQSPPWVKVEPE
jgi:hypothetical protein